MFPELILELLEIVTPNFRNAQIIQSCLIPATELVTALRPNIDIDFAADRRPDEHIDDLFSALDSIPRLAYTPAEAGAAIGRDKPWVYRRIYAGKRIVWQTGDDSAGRT